MTSLPIKNPTLAIIGLGYVGLPLAIAFSRKFDVIGFDINHERILSLKGGKDNTGEFTHDEIMQAENSIFFSSSIDDLKGADIFIITVPTPIDSANRPNLKALKSATEIVSRHLKKNSIVIYESTVYPGCTEEVCVPILEHGCNLKLNEDFVCGYSPERINPGDKENRIETIIKITSGSNKIAGEYIDNLYKQIISVGTFLAPSIKVAEAAKIIENTQRDLNIALINELSMIFHRLDIDTHDVLEAASTKWNFNKYYPGFVGGHCIGVDPYYLTHKSEMVGYNPQVILAGRRINDNMAKYAARAIMQLLSKSGKKINGSKIGVFGVTFKNNCPDIRNSKIFDAISEFHNWGASTLVYDPIACPKEVNDKYGVQLTDINSLGDLDAIFLAVPHNEFINLELEFYKSISSKDSPIFADLKSLFQKKSLTNLGFQVFRL